MRKEDIPHQPWFVEIKGATRDLIRKAGKLVRVAEFLECSEAVVGNWNNWEQADLMPAWAMVQLEQDRGLPILSGAYARLTGATVTNRVPGTQSRRPGSILQEISASGIEFAEFQIVNARAAEDNHYTVAELREMLGRLDDVDSQNAATRSAINAAIAAAGGAK